MRVWINWLAFLLFLAAGVLFSLLVVQHHQKKALIAQPAAPSKNQAAVQFDFYTALPKMEVSLTQPQQPANNFPISNDKKTIATTKYALQIAAFHQLADANRMLEHIRQAKFPAFIQPFQDSTNIWYRVLIGPILLKN